MKPGYILFVMFAAPLGILFATQGAGAPPERADMTCVDKRVTSYGYTHPQVALAELAAIVTWQGDAEKKNPGLSNWHLARGRSMNCRQFKKSGHFQCVLSATPCRMNKS
ncbi:MAG TPA: hypothetical protein ENH05_07615 [Rhizobiales bacterium]|nr:hypothetical protein BMS3Bbin10_01969 [bacterium BMS3Bbin10]HDO52588.1 hypothetical protein [Hyphomicrobiales bacterium]